MFKEEAGIEKPMKSNLDRQGEDKAITLWEVDRRRGRTKDHAKLVKMRSKVGVISYLGR